MEAVRLFSKWNRTNADASMLAALGADSIANKQYQEMSRDIRKYREISENMWEC